MVYLLLVYTSMETINIAKQIGTLYTNKTKFNFLKMKWTEVFTTQTISSNSVNKKLSNLSTNNNLEKFT